MTNRQSLPRALWVLALALTALALSASPALAAPPLISGTSFSAVGDTSATLQATLNPNNRPVTDYHFEYVDQAGFEAQGFTAAKSTPAGTLPTGIVGVPVSALIGGLGPATTYHFRLLATNNKAEKAEGPDTAFATYASPVFGPCPNDSFRAEHPSAKLSDCRAYEQASPIDKNGADVIGSVFLNRASLSGDGITFLTNSGLPGGVGASEFPLYLAHRDASGWSTQGILAPPSFGGRGGYVGWTPDLAYAFETAAFFESDETPVPAFLSRSADGSFQTIVPHTPNAGYSLAGSSADDSKIFFEARGEGVNVTGDAATGKDNLYRFDRDTGEISLVGVLPDPACATPPCTPPGGSFAGPWDWWHPGPAALRQGGAAEGYFTQDRHAISASGEKAYFTAGDASPGAGDDGQIYLRKGLDGPSPETVHVSAPERSGAPDTAGTRPAIFQAATPDGSRAFFTSSEKLTDNATTGPEPPLATIARADLGGSLASVDLGFLPAHAWGTAVDGSHIYWADPEAGTIGRANLNGTGVEEEFIAPGPAEVEPGVSVPSKPQWVAVDSEYVYWTNTGKEGADGKGLDGKGTIGRAKLDHSEPPDPDFIKGASNPRGIAVNATHIYWANAGTKNDTAGIARADIGGNPASVIQPWSVGAGGNPSGFDAAGVALDDTYLYFTRGEKVEGAVMRIELDERLHVGPILSTESAENFQGIAVEGNHVYWANRGKDAIGRATLNPYPAKATEVEPKFIEDAGNPQGLAADAEHLYWSANQGKFLNPGNDLYRYDVTGDPGDGHHLTDISVDPSDKNGAEVQGVIGTSEDGSHVYFVANGDLDGPGGQAGKGDCTAASFNFNSSGTCNLYLWREGASTAFLARLDVSGDGFVSDAANWQATPVAEGGTYRRMPTGRVSADGQVVLFRSQEKLTAYDNEGVPELYRFQVGEGAPTCVSCNPTGAAPIGPPTLQSIDSPGLDPSNQPVFNRALSADGKRVFFETPDKLALADVNGVKDVYEWEAEGAGSCKTAGGCLYLLSSGASPAPSFLADASVSGDDAFILTRDQLVPQDTDQILDLYDARALGGLASQNPPPPPPPCEGDACRQRFTSPAAPQGAGTLSFQGPGSPAVKRHKSKRRHHKKRHHRKRSHVRANSNQGGEK